MNHNQQLFIREPFWEKYKAQFGVIGAIIHLANHGLKHAFFLSALAAIPLVAVLSRQGIIAFFAYDLAFGAIGFLVGFTGKLFDCVGIEIKTNGLAIYGLGRKSGLFSFSKIKNLSCSKLPNQDYLMWQLNSDSFGRTKKLELVFESSQKTRDFYEELQGRCT